MVALQVLVSLVFVFGLGYCNSELDLYVIDAQSDIHYAKQYAEVGHILSTTCAIGASEILPETMVVWEQRGYGGQNWCKKDAYDKRYKVTCASRGTSKLTITDVTSKDNGTEWLCTDRGPGSKTKYVRAVRLAVRDGPHAIRFSPTNTNQYIVDEGSSLNITCTSICFPSCSFKWSKRKNNPVLSFQSLTRSDTGNYTCVAQNGRVSNKRLVEILVRYGPNKIQLVPNTVVYEQLEKAQLNIACFAACYPQCNYTWTNTVSNEAVSFSPELHMTSLHRSAAGQYQCTAENCISTSVSRQVDVRVKYGPGNVQLWPSETVYNEREKSQLHITCSADCNPDCTYTWKNPFTGFERVSQTLKFDRLKRSQSGVYSCTAKNGIWNTTKAVQINVLYGPYEVQLTPNETDRYTLSMGDDLHVKCSSDCSPTCTYSWIRKGQHHQNFLEDSQTLHISRVKRTDAGFYICTAQNGIVSAIGTVEVRVEFDPDAPRHFQFVGIVNDDCVFCWERLNTHVYGEENTLAIEVHLDGNIASRTSHQVKNEDRFNYNGRPCLILSANFNPGIYTATMLVRNEYGQSVSNTCSFEIAAKVRLSAKSEVGNRPNVWSTVGYVAAGVAITTIAIITIMVLKKKCKNGPRDQTEEMLIFDDNRVESDALPEPREPAVLDDGNVLLVPLHTERPLPAHQTSNVDTDTPTTLQRELNGLGGGSISHAQQTAMHGLFLDAAHLPLHHRANNRDIDVPTTTRRQPTQVVECDALPTIIQRQTERPLPRLPYDVVDSNKPHDSARPLPKEQHEYDDDSTHALPYQPRRLISDAPRRIRRPLPPEPHFVGFVGNLTQQNNARMLPKQPQLLDVAKLPLPWQSTRPYSRQPYGLDGDAEWQANPVPPSAVHAIDVNGPSVPTRPLPPRVSNGQPPVPFPRKIHARLPPTQHPDNDDETHRKTRFSPRPELSSSNESQCGSVVYQTFSDKLACDNISYGHINDFLDIQMGDSFKENVYAEVTTPLSSLRRLSSEQIYVNLKCRKWNDSLRKTRRNSWSLGNRSTYPFRNKRRRHTVNFGLLGMTNRATL